MKKKELFICDNCGSFKLEVFLTNVISWEHAGSFNFIRCIHCGLICLYPRPAQSAIGKYYPKESYWGDDDSKAARDNRYNFIYQQIMNKKEKGTILDIGAGTGLFLTKFNDLGWEVSGIELSKTAVSFAQENFGIKLRNGDFLDFSFPKEHFDVVTLNNVLEHLYKPSDTLKKIFQVLKNDGLLVITIPNIESLGSKIFGKNWHALQPPRHLYHFSVKTITDMLGRSRFSVEQIKHNYWAHNYYSLFESFRFLLSPRFTKKEQGGLKNNNYNRRFSIILEIGKLVGLLFASALAFVGANSKRGEVITIYARKKD